MLAPPQDDGTIALWNLATGARIATVAGHLGLVNCVCVNGDGRTAVSAGDDGTLRVWKLEWQSGVDLDEGMQRVKVEVEKAREQQEAHLRARIQRADSAWAGGGAGRGGG